MNQKFLRSALIAFAVIFSFSSCNDQTEVEDFSAVSLKSAPVQVNGTFSFLTYNVAGLWDPVTPANPSVNTIQISPKLNGYDIVCVQEDWNYHSDLIAHVNHSYLSSHSGSMGIGDGLNRMSVFPFSSHNRTAWNSCYGYTSNGNDCLTPKGYSFARHEISPGIFLDVYNVHADAGVDSGDVNARISQFQQIISSINSWSVGNAVIVAGDFNSHFIAAGEVRQFLDQGFLDAEIEIEHGGNYPAVGQWVGETIDKIMYKSSPSLQLTVTGYSNEKNNFLDGNGNDLSDHHPRLATFSYTGTANGGPTVSLKTWKNTYLQAEWNGGGNVWSDPSAIGPWEKFKMLNLDADPNTIKSGDIVYIQTGGGQYFTGHPGGDLKGDAQARLDWEKFTLINHTDPTGHIENGDVISLKSFHNMYVVAESNRDANANRTAIGAWEQFTVVIH